MTRRDVCGARSMPDKGADVMASDLRSVTRHLAIVSALLGSAAASPANAEPGDPATPEHGCAHASFDGPPLRDGRPLPRPVRGEYDDDTDVLHYDLELEIVPDDEMLIGRSVLTVRSCTTDLAHLDVWLDTLLDIASITVDGQPASWMRPEFPIVRIALDQLYGEDEVFEVAIDYQGFPEPEWRGSISFDLHGGTPVVWTYSQPWYAYTWQPVKEDNTDKATGELHIIAPDWMVVASNGLHQGTEDLPGERQVTSWRTDYQTTPYLFSFAATDYDVIASNWVYQGYVMPLEFYIYPEHNTVDNVEALLEISDMLEAFGDLFGPYPFIDEKYGVCQTELGGGMEHQTISTQGYFDGWLNAHELAHQWWGDLITCDTWHHIWLNEGFATYAEALWMEARAGDVAALHDWMATRPVGPSAGVVYVDDPSNPSRVFRYETTYKKAAWVLHQLRYIVGKQVFLDILAEYRSRHAFETVVTDDFIAAAEDVSGLELNWFFDPWLYEPGIADYDAAWQVSEMDGSYLIDVKLEQSGAWGAPLFTMPIEIVVLSSDGETHHRIWNDDWTEYYVLESHAEPLEVVVDPDHWILRRDVGTASMGGIPPKIIRSDVMPGERLPVAALERGVTLTFQTDVTMTTNDVELLDGAGALVPVLVSPIDGDERFMRLTVLGDAQPGAATLTVYDTVRNATTYTPLDGELTHDWGEPTLPSGDGQTGGDAIFAFTIVPPGDLNGDGIVDMTDLGILLASFEVDDGGDIDGDGDTDISDLGALLAWYGYGT
jgi:aminopeptidase N